MKTIIKYIPNQIGRTSLTFNQYLNLPTSSIENFIINNIGCIKKGVIRSIKNKILEFPFVTLVKFYNNGEKYIIPVNIYKNLDYK